MISIHETDRTALREAWLDYCNTLRQQGEEIVNGTYGDPRSAQELAEALRAVARMGIMSLQHRMDFNDPDFPVFFRTMDDRYKYGGPDAYITYMTAALRGGAAYRLNINHQHREFNVNLSDPAPRTTAAAPPASPQLWPEDMKIETDGSVEVTLSSEPVPGNWLPLDPHFATGDLPPNQYPMAAGGLMLRTYYWDTNDRLPPGRFTIERVDPLAPLVPAPLTVPRLVAQFKSASTLLAKAARWWIARAERMRAQNQPNVVMPLGKTPPGVQGFTVGQSSPLNYGVTAFDLAPNEALLIETDLPPTLYWSFQLYNVWWESPDVQNRQTSLSQSDAFIDADGRFRTIVAHADPKVPNWLDTGTSARGFVFYRWLRPQAELPCPVGKVVKLADVRQYLPPEHPHVDSETRRSQLAARRAYFAQRFQS